MNNNHSQGGSFNAFLWGLIIGGGAVFLFGTKKGKKILKTITEEGLELSELFGEEEDEEKPEERSSNGETKPQEPEETLTKITTAGKHFFKGIPKKRGF